MDYHKEIFYQPAEGAPHKKVTEDELRQLVGWNLAYNALMKVSERVALQNITPEIEAFFRGDIARAAVVASLTNRGNIYIELVEGEEVAA